MSQKRIQFIALIFAGTLLINPKVQIQHHQSNMAPSGVIERLSTMCMNIRVDVSILTPVFAASMHEYD